MDYLHKLEQLTELYKKGILTKEEFEKEKAKITVHIGLNKSNHIDDNKVQASINKDSSQHRKRWSKRTRITICISVLLVIGGIIFIALYKNPYERALEKIDDCRGYILADIEDNNRHKIIYSVSEGLYFWDTKEKSGKKLFSNMDSLTVRTYFIDHNTCGVTFFDSPYLEMIERMTLSTDKKSSLKGLDSDIFSVSWPWIIIGTQFVAHVSEPNTLININNYKTSNSIRAIYNPYKYTTVAAYDDEMDANSNFTDSVDITSNGELVLTLAGWASTLPGYNDYKPTLIDQPSLTYHWYIDNKLFNEYESLIPEEEIFKRLTMLLPINDFFYRTVIIDKFNFCKVKKEIKLDDMIIYEEELSKEGLQKVFLRIDVKCRDFLLKEIPKKREELDSYVNSLREKRIQEIQDEAISVYQIRSAYQGNPSKARQLYPYNHEGIFEAEIYRIEGTSVSGLYRLVADSCDDLYRISIFTRDKTFLNFIYPKKVWFSAVLDDYYMYDHFGKCYTLDFIHAKALIWEND